MKLVLYIIFNLVFVQAKNILIIQHVATQTYSNIFEAIAITLATEHNVTFINRFDLKELHPNITLVPTDKGPIDVKGVFGNVVQTSRVQDDNSIISINAVLSDTRREMIDTLMTDPSIKYIFETKHLYDILIIPSTLSLMLIRFAHLMDIPLVQVATSHPMPWQNEAIGNLNYISTDSSLLLGPHSENFYGRLVKFIQGTKLLYRYHFKYLPALNEYTDKYFPPNTPRIEEISKNTSLLLVNIQAPMVLIRPRVANYVEIGGIQCRPSKDLSSKLKNFLDHTEGIIYMSLGFTVKSDFPQDLLKSIFKVFRKLPQRVIFKFDQDVDDAFSNILVLKSCPQQDILGHPNTRLFITQGGMLSLQEAVFHGVPVLVLPLMFDQPTNAILANKLGYGKYLRWSKFSEETFLKEISEILSNKKYSNRAKELSVLTKDVQHDPKENLKWWINYILRHKGMPTSKYNQHEYNPTTYHIDLDILIFLIFVAVVLFVLSVLVLVFISRFIKKYIKVKIE